MATPSVAPEERPAPDSTPASAENGSGDEPESTEPSVGGTPSGMPRSRLRVRRRWLAVFAALLLIVAVVAVEVPQWLFPPAASTATIWQSITAGITNGTVPKQTALEAFSYVYKVGIPGVTVPSGVEGGDEPTSGTGVMSWVQANWTSLTPDQQAVINRYLPPATEAGTQSMLPDASDTPSADQAAPQFQLDKTANPWPIATDLAPDAPMLLGLAMAHEVVADLAHIGPKLNLPVIGRGLPLLPTITLTLTDQSGGDAFFLTQIVQNSNIGYFEPCNITAYSEAWKSESATSGGGVSSRLHVLITHEIIHCYQNVVWGDLATALAIPPWMKEGTAIYLAADDTGLAEPVLADVWQKGYFGRPETALTNRTYDAIGYFALLAHQGRDLWSLMTPAWEAAAKSSERSNAFIAALHGDDSDIVNNWAESLLRRSDWNDPWIAYGFGIPDAAQAPQHSAQAQLSPGWLGSVESRANTVLSVDGTSGEVVTVATDGLASVHDDNGNSATAFANQTFCTADKGCVCPEGTLLAGQNMASQKLSIPFVAAFNGAVGGSTYSIVADTLDNLCKRRATPQPTFQPTPQGTPNYGQCGQKCSQSNGDPHLLTLNNYRYDFQAAGEFHLLESSDGSVDIQARQEPFGAGYVSINTAVAAKVGTHRVGVYMTDTGLNALVDGSAVDLSGGPQDLGNGGRISAVAKGFEIDFPDGTALWTLSLGHYGINAQVKPSAALLANGIGPLSSVIPGGLGIPAMPDGSRFPAASSDTDRAATINGPFADAWRVTDATTLFDYDSGKSTSTYTIKPYPTAVSTGLSGLTSDQTAAGSAACVGITDPGLHDDCVFDVGLTGQAGFAQIDAVTQEFYDAGVSAPTPTPPHAPASAPAGAVSGAMTVTQATALGGYALGADDTVYMSVQTGASAFSLISFDPVAGKIVHQVSVPALTKLHFAAGSVWLPALKTDSNGHNCSITRFDGSTLTEQATIAVPCDFFGTAGATASDGDALWFMDVSKYDSTSLKGAVMTRIDPQTNQPGTSVPLPSINGSFKDSVGAFFYGDTQQNYFRLTSGSTAFDSLGSMSGYFSETPGGTGLWAASGNHITAVYYTQAGTPQATVQIGGNLAGGDAHAVYEEVQASSQSGFENQLWRYPLDGSTPTEIAVAPSIDGGPLNYVEDPLPITNGDGILKIWQKRTGDQQAPTILLQWTPER